MGISLISNPPYNLRHQLPQLAGMMSRYAGWTLPPESNANYAFILSGLDMVDDRAVFLLPNGVLTTNEKSERQIRQELVNENLLLSVIALPGGMFESTSIPTCLLVFDKHKQTKRVAMIDLTDKCEEQTRDQRGQFGGTSHTNRTYHKSIKVIPQQLINRCIELINKGEDEEGLCIWVSDEQIKSNDYILSPKRYFEIKF